MNLATLALTVWSVGCAVAGALLYSTIANLLRVAGGRR
jgi:hypothetical protein